MIYGYYIALFANLFFLDTFGVNWNLTVNKIIADNVSVDNKFYHEDKLAKDLEYNFLSRPLESKK